MNNYLKSGLVAAALFSMPVAAFAQQHTVYFNQNGKLTATMPSVAYVRQYKIEAGKAQVQDFYYPSMKNILILMKYLPVRLRFLCRRWIMAH